MLVVTARLFKDNQLVGYRISDGKSTQDLTKRQAWVYAKNKQIMDVVAVGTENEPGLSGINGFELKYLPQVQMQKTVDVKYNSQDILAAVLDKIANDSKYYDYICSNNIDKKDVRNESIDILKTRAMNGGLANRRVWTNNVTVENVLSIGGHTVGYTFKNISQSSVGVYRIPIEQLENKTLIELRPGDTIELSRAEAALTLSLPQYSGCVKNYKLVATSAQPTEQNRYNYLWSHYLCALSSDTEVSTKSLEVNEYTKIYIINEKMLSAPRFANNGVSIPTMLLNTLADTADKAGVDSSEFRAAADSVRDAQKKHIEDTVNKLKTVKTSKGLLDAFKR